MGVFDELLDWFLPTKCTLCADPGSPICSSCLARLEISNRIVNREHLTGFAVAKYNHEFSMIFSSIKEQGQTAIIRTLAQYLALAITQNFSTEKLSSIVLVPAPSSFSSFQKRGFKPALVLARRTAHEVRLLTGISLKIQEALSFNRLVLDQAGLGLHERRTNLAGAMVAKPPRQRTTALILDDVVTTGATVIECARALQVAGWSVASFCSFAETLSKNATQK